MAVGACFKQGWNLRATSSADARVAPEAAFPHVELGFAPSTVRLLGEWREREAHELRPRALWARWTNEELARVLSAPAVTPEERKNRKRAMGAGAKRLRKLRSGPSRGQEG